MKQIKITKNILNERSEILSDYFKEMNNYNILTPSEELNLAYEIKNGSEEAKTKLVNANLRFVVTCAKQYVNQGVPLADLINAGNLGLIEAVNRYDPDKGYRFISFAVWYIRREILKEIYNTGRTVRYPITFISKITKVKKAYDKFINENEREPTDDELLNLTNLTQKQYDKVILNKSYCQSLDTPLYEDVKLEDTIPDSEVDQDFTTDAILNCISHLNAREQKVIKEYFGIGCPAKKVQEIAEELRLGPERVRQIRKEAIKKLGKFKNILKVYL
jgi:RNA polymerase primary sigma factor